MWRWLWGERFRRDVTLEGEDVDQSQLLPSSSDERRPPKDSPLLRISRGLGVIFWVCALANGIYLVVTLPNYAFWISIQKISGGLLLVLVAFACCMWEAGAMRRKKQETWCSKVVREVFLAAMYFVVGGFVLPTEKPEASERIFGLTLCIFGWLMALLRVFLLLIPCVLRSEVERMAAELRHLRAQQMARRHPEHGILRTDVPTSPESSSDLPLPRVSDLEPGTQQRRMPKQRNEVAPRPAERSSMSSRPRNEPDAIRATGRGQGVTEMAQRNLESSNVRSHDSAKPFGKGRGAQEASRSSPSPSNASKSNDAASENATGGRSRSHESASSTSAVPLPRVELPKTEDNGEDPPEDPDPPEGLEDPGEDGPPEEALEEKETETAKERNSQV